MMRVKCISCLCAICLSSGLCAKDLQDPLLTTQTSKNVSVDQVFHSPLDNLKKKPKPEEESSKKKLLFPSPAFLSQMDKWNLRIGDVTLLRDNVAFLLNKHKDCRILDVVGKEKTSNSEGRIACSATRNFSSEGDAVIFTFSKTNDILTGATYFFNSAFRGKNFSEDIKKTIEIKQPTFTKYYSEDSFIVESPMLNVSLQKAQKGYLVVVRSNYNERFSDLENHSKFKIKQIEFGEITIGKTTKDEFEILVKNMPKSCEDVSFSDEPNIREFYGVCFGFPYEAHMQINFDEDTQQVTSAILSPIGSATGDIVEDMLSSKYDLPSYCKRIETEVQMAEIKSIKSNRASKLYRFNKPRTGFIFAGNCDQPLIYTTGMRYIFETRYLSSEEIMNNFLLKKENYEYSLESDNAYNSRKEKVKGFFD